MAPRCQTIERIFRTWLDLSKDKDILVLLVLLQRQLRRRGYHVSVEIARDVGAVRDSARGEGRA